MRATSSSASPKVACNKSSTRSSDCEGLPLAYDRDLQEDKSPVFAARRDTRLALGALAVLVEGIELNDGKPVKFLRDRDLVDPMTGKREWTLRSNTDAFDATSTDGNNVFDVHSTSTRLALDGKTHYNEW